MRRPNREKESLMWNREGTPVKPQTPNMAEPVSPPLPAEERRVVAWVGKSVIFKGTLVSSEDMTIDGHVEGSIEVKDQGLTIGPDADIRADIVASTVTIHGKVIGHIRASAKVDVLATGHIEGDIVAPRIVLADGAVVCGRVDTSGEQSDAAKLRAQMAIV
jgi:cytoskeletal protein CcmA (bactofilin family)